MPRIVHTCNKESEIASIQTDLKYMREKIDELHEKVVGNGKLGLVDEMNQIKGGLKMTQWFFGACLGIIGLLVAFL